MTASKSAAVVAGMALDAMKRAEHLDQANRHEAAGLPQPAGDAKAAAVHCLRVLIHTAPTKRAEILEDQAFLALDAARSPAERLEIVNRFFEEFALGIDILEATTGEPPQTAAARAAAERGRHLRSSIDPVARYMGRRLVLAAYAPACPRPSEQCARDHQVVRRSMMSVAVWRHARSCTHHKLPFHSRCLARAVEQRLKRHGGVAYFSQNHDKKDVPYLYHR